MDVESSLTDHYAICDFYAVTFYSFIYCHVLKGLFRTDDVDFENESVLALTFTGDFFVDALQAIGAAV